MTERWRKKLGDIDGASPNDDVFARANEGPQQPDPMVPLPSTGNRVATGIAAFMVFALAISVFAIPVLRMSDPAGPGSSQLLPLWPERSLDDLEALQAAADSGDADAAWVTDPEQVAVRFGERVLGWESVDLSGSEMVSCLDPACPIGLGGGNVIADCSPYAVTSGGETGFACVGSAVAAPGYPEGTYESATYGSSSAPPDPFRSYELQYDAPCDVCPAPTTVRLYQPLDSGEGKVWAVLEAASRGASLDVSVGQALQDGETVVAVLRRNGTTTPTIAYQAGPGACQHVGAAGPAPYSDAGGPTVSVRLDVHAGCSEDTPGYVWAAMTWKPLIGSGGVFDPLQTTHGNPIFSFIAVPVTILAAQATGTFSEPPTREPTVFSSPTPQSPGSMTSFTDERYGVVIRFPDTWQAEPYDEAGQVGFHVASGPIGFQDAPDRIERVFTDPGEVVLFVWTEDVRSTEDDRLPQPGAIAGAHAAVIRGTFTADGLEWHYLIEAGEGDEAIAEGLLPQLDTMLGSISFQPWTVGETRNEWTAVGPILDSGAAEWMVFQGKHYFATSVDGHRRLLGPVPTCEGATYEVRDDGAVAVSCADGTGGEWSSQGQPEPSNSPGFGTGCSITFAIRSWDGFLLV